MKQLAHDYNRRKLKKHVSLWRRGLNSEHRATKCSKSLDQKSGGEQKKFTHLFPPGEREKEFAVLVC